LRLSLRANQRTAKAAGRRDRNGGRGDDYGYGKRNLFCHVVVKMKEFAEALIAAILIVGIVVWTAKTLVEVLR
jgi:hypothetical protein